MPSPFPGMDPWIERPARWPDFHMAMLVFMRSALAASLPDRYDAELDTYVWLEDADEETHRAGAPDLFVAAAGSGEASEAVATMAAPRTARLPARRRRTGARYMRIVDHESRRVVTVLELLSPANKGPDREAYLDKRRDLIDARTNLVEIDLLRAGHRPVPRSASDYRVLVSRACDHPRVGLWDFSVRDPLPVVPIPLDPSEAPVDLALRPCFDRVYDEGRYQRKARYAEPPEPRLDAEDAAWAAALLARRTAPGADAPGSP
ncbi:MAG: DUF4058 family protein [Gemmataceae bacterium]|nr:DUF4058 family protein [Gemmataceae bacterium]